MEKSLDDLLNDDDTADTVEAVASDDGHVTIAQPRDDTGRFAPKETGVETPQPEQVAETVPPTADRLPPDTFKGFKEEREKRQALERELEALRKQIEAQQNPPAPPPSVWEDDQAALQHVQRAAVTESVQKAAFDSRLITSEMLMRQADPEFSASWQEMNEFLASNPALIERCTASPHPWNEAFTLFRNHKRATELGATNVAELEARLREKIMAEMQQTAAPASIIPPSLTNERNVGSRSGPAWAGPKPLSELLG